MEKYTEREGNILGKIHCPKHGLEGMFGLGKDGFCVGSGCSKCFEKLPIKKLRYRK